MIRNILLATAAIAVATGPVVAAPTAQAATSATLPASNPFAQPSRLALQAPDFSKIKDSDYLPAILAGMAQQKREDDGRSPTTRRRRRSTTRWSRWSVRAAARARRPRILGGRPGEHQRYVAERTDTTTAPLAAAHKDCIFLNAKLFARVKALHDRAGAAEARPGAARSCSTYYYKQFVHAGREASGAEQDRAEGAQRAHQHAADRISHISCWPRPRPARLHVDRQGRARGPARGANRRGRRGRQGAQARRLCPAAAEHHPAAVAGVADQPRHAAEAVQRRLESRRKGRRQRHPQRSRAKSLSCARRRRSCSAIRTGPTTSCTTRWRRTARRQSVFSIGWCRRVSAKQHDEARRHPETGRRPGRRLQGRPGGLELLFRADPQAALRDRQRRAEAIFRVQQGARGRRVLRRQPALRDDLQGAEGHPDRGARTCACSTSRRCRRQAARRSS